jgi:hypothetical protein
MPNKRKKIEPKVKIRKDKKTKVMKQTQSQKVIINLNEVKTKNTKKTKQPRNKKGMSFKEISTNPMPEGWVKYGPQDDREINTLRGNLTNIGNKLLTIQNAENPVNNNNQERILKIEEGLKNMFVNGNNTFSDLYSKFDSIGDFTLKTKLKNPVKEDEKKQAKPIYLETNQQTNIKGIRGRPKGSKNKNKNKTNKNEKPYMNQETNTNFINESSIAFDESNSQNDSSINDLISNIPLLSKDEIEKSLNITNKLNDVFTF